MVTVLFPPPWFTFDSLHAPRLFETRDPAVFTGQRSLGGGATIFRTEEGRSDQWRPVGTGCSGRWFGPDLRSLSALRASIRLQRLPVRSEEHSSELQSLAYLVCRLLLEKKKKI